jgi:hypothetical protein
MVPSQRQPPTVPAEYLAEWLAKQQQQHLRATTLHCSELSLHGAT